MKWFYDQKQLSEDFGNREIEDQETRDFPTHNPSAELIN